MESLKKFQVEPLTESKRNLYSNLEWNLWKKSEWNPGRNPRIFFIESRQNSLKDSLKQFREKSILNSRRVLEELVKKSREES